MTTQLATVSSYLSDDAPSVQMLKSRIEALQSEISRIQGKVSQGADASAPSDPQNGDAPPEAMATTIAQYKELETSQQLAEQAYAAALASVERARADSERTQSYLAVYLPPRPTDAAAFPSRGVDVTIVFLLSLVAWVIGLLGYFTVRDHMA